MPFIWTATFASSAVAGQPDETEKSTNNTSRLNVVKFAISPFRDTGRAVEADEQRAV